MNEIPEAIALKIRTVESEVERKIVEANSSQKTTSPKAVSFRYQHSAPGDILTESERAQSICFVSRYDHLPHLEQLDIVEREGKWFLQNVAFVRHILNEYRSIINNQDDSIYYKNVHRFCREKLTNQNPSSGLSITVVDEGNMEITAIFLRILDEKVSAIRVLLERSEFDYIYNGILQHSDHRYAQRLLQEYHSGELNYTFLRHAKLLGCIKEQLYWHHVILNQLTFPKLGPL